MQFRSERDQQLAIKVITQMIALIDSLLQRMEFVQTEADLSGNKSGRLLLDAVCMQYLALGEAVKQLDKITRDVLAHQYFNIDPRQVLWITREALPLL